MFLHKTSRLVAVTILSGLFLGGCTTTNTGASHRPIIDGRVNQQYEIDLRECQAIASQRDYFSNENTQNTIAGAAVGGILGADGLSGVVTGAAIGAAIAATGSALNTRGDQKDIVINCMQNRGYTTLESTG